MRGLEPRRPGEEPLIVRLPDGQVLDFTTAFHIGREPGCEVTLDDVRVSRRHAEVLRLQGRWVIRDLQSSNGLFVDGARVDAAPIGDGVLVSLGADGPRLQIEPEAVDVVAPAWPAEPPADDGPLLDAYAQRYFGSEDDDAVSGRTLMIRKAFQSIQERQRRKQRVAIAAVTLLALGAAGFALYQYRLIGQQAENAKGFFYAMKVIDVRIAALEQKLAPSGDASGQRMVAEYIAQRRQLESNYERYVAALYDRKLNEKDRLILRVTRLFGECDVAAPPDYVREISRYIGQWKSTGRFERAVNLARDRGYTERIAREFMTRQLPPQYFYLAMVESDFIADRSGPWTRWGYAKGMWQFIPETGRTYGLRIGPRAAGPDFDPYDERFDWEKATVAAAKYVKDIYATDAQASGLLVMASYNWGERRVIDLLATMPRDPRERNFWKLLAKYRDRLPLETYNYVFSIVSAAVIGENPRLFGFRFDSPLKFVEQADRPGEATGRTPSAP